MIPRLERDPGSGKVGITVGTQTFLPLDEPFLPVPIRTTPRVWIEHVRIYAARDRELRRIALKPGLNVIWAPDAGPEERLGTRIGHGAGKTLLARLLRHVLGETDLASPEDAEALRHTFPEGFVEAEVHVEGVRWAVRRFFDPKAGSVAVRDGGLEALDGAALDYDAFLDALRASLGESARSLSGAEGWLAALAWMSRDQERRFGGALRWRDRLASPSSKIARVANVERLRAVRSLLRLRTADDLAAEHAVSELERAEKLTVRQLADCTREVTWLAVRLAREGVGDVSELSGQPLVLRAAIGALEAELATLEDVGDEPASLRAARVEHARALREEAMQSVRVEQREATLAMLRAHGEHDAEHASDASCPHCHVPAAVMLEQKSAIQRAEREHARATKELARLQKKLARIEQRLEREQSRDRAEQREARARFADVRERVLRARELERQVQRRQELTDALASVQRELADARVERERALREHGKRVGRVSDVYDFVVRRLAGQDVSGRFAITATSLEARIRLPDGRSGTSPAWRVLETLALDLTALVLACEDRADLPGLLLHDSPREADLARSHYDALYRLASWLEDATDAPGFQYIVTTTTSPPRALAFRAIRLGAATPDELLLRTPLRQ